MQELSKMYAAYGMDMGQLQRKDQSLVLNVGNKLVERLVKGELDDRREILESVVRQLYDMALLQRGGLSADEMTAFIRRTEELMLKL